MNTNQYYQANMPHGTPFIMSVAWSSGSTPTLKIEPVLNEVIYIDEIGIRAEDNFAPDTGETINLDGLYETDGVTGVVIDSLSKLKAVMEELLINTDEVCGKIKMRPPLRLLYDSGTKPVLEIANSDGETATITGTIAFTVKGWRIIASNE
jgi:hypothetical protein